MNANTKQTQAAFTPGRFPWQLQKPPKCSPDFHDAKVALIADAMKHPKMKRAEARDRVSATMCDLRAKYPGVIWASFPARLLDAALRQARGEA